MAHEEEGGEDWCGSGGWAVGGEGKHTPIKRCTRVAEGRVLELGGNNSLCERL